MTNQKGPENSANHAFRLLLELAKNKAAHASGLTPKDYKYGAAESVRKADIEGWVYVTIGGKEYGPTRETWGLLDGSHEKMTALVNTRGDEDKQDSWIKLEYFEKDVKPFEENK